MGYRMAARERLVGQVVGMVDGRLKGAGGSRGNRTRLGRGGSCRAKEDGGGRAHQS